MSLGVAFKGPEGIVLAADSRVTLLAERAGDRKLIPATFDNATKLLFVKAQQNVGAVTYGLGALGAGQPRTAHSFLPEFEEELRREGPERQSVEDFARGLSNFFLRQWGEQGMPEAAGYTGEPMIFLVGGYDEGAAYGRVFDFFIPQRPQPVEQHANDFGITWGGQRTYAERLINGYDTELPARIARHLELDAEGARALEVFLRQNFGTPIPYQFLPLQDCIDLSVFIIRTTMQIQTWTVGVRGVGGAIDVATVTRVAGLSALKTKEVSGDRFAS